jgi:tripartite-type tricarboxylate transporter receptor subunit TctC
MVGNTCGRAALIGAAAVLLTAGAAAAQSVADFYKGKTVTLTVGTDAGGGYDQYARTLARHMGRHIPGNPSFVTKNMPGAGGLQANNRIYRVAPKDGTEFGTAHRGIPILPLLGQADDYDASKFTWIGSMNQEISVCYSWHTSPVKTFEDLRKTELIVGTTGKGADLSSFEQPLINLLGAKLKVIHGYEGGQNIDRAVEQGEIQGRCGVSWSSMKARNTQWIKDKTVNILVQLGIGKHEDLPDIPTAQDFAKSPEDKIILDLLLTPQLIGRPYFAPPGLPADRARALRDAFNATLTDPELLAEADKQKLEIELIKGEQIEKLINQAYAAPAPVIAKAREAIK